MTKSKFFIYLLLGAFWLTGCATGKTTVVLLPDPDGKVGQVEISNNKGTKKITRAGYAVSVSNDSAPQSAVEVSEIEVNSIFAKALVAEPVPPAKYILYFFWNSTKLKPDSRKAIKEIIIEIEKRASNDIEVIGHTDRSGTDEFNMTLSQNRAVKVRELLIAANIAPTAIRVGFHGEGNPLITTVDNVPEPRNRRVEVIVR